MTSTPTDSPDVLSRASRSVYDAEIDMPRVPQEQRDAYLSFEGRDVSAQSWLCNVELLGGLEKLRHSASAANSRR